MHQAKYCHLIASMAIRRNTCSTQKSVKTRTIFTVNNNHKSLLSPKLAFQLSLAKKKKKKNFKNSKYAIQNIQ